MFKDYQPLQYTYGAKLIARTKQAQNNHNNLLIYIVIFVIFASMKNRIILTLFTLIAMALYASADADIKWLKVNHNFGAFNENDGPVTCSYRYVNSGDKPLVIVSARATCGCTSPKYSDKKLAPGDTAEISVTFNPKGRLGRFEKKVYVETNTRDSRSILTLGGVIIGSPETLAERFPYSYHRVNLSNRIVPLGEVYKGRTKSVFVDVYNSSTDTLRPKAIAMPQYLEVDMAPEILPPGQQGTLVLYVRSDKCQQWGLIDSNVSIVDDRDNPADTININTVLTVNEDFSQLSEADLAKAPICAPSTDSLDFGTIDTTIPETLTRSFELSNIGKNKLAIRRIYTETPGIVIDHNTKDIKSGNSSMVTVNISPSELSGDMLNSRISIITNDPINPVQSVRIVGTFKKIL